MSQFYQKLFLVILLLFLGVVLFTGSYFLIKTKSIEIIISPAQISAPFQKELITIIFTGDLMLDRGVEYMIEKEGDGDYRFPFLKIAKELKKADLLFGNLESQISDKGTKVGSIYSFRADPKTIEGLSFAGFNILSVANNHAFDYGREALEDSFLRLKKTGIDYVGGGLSETEAYSPIIKEVNNTKIAFLAYTNLGLETWKAVGEKSGIAWLNEKDIEKIKEDIKLAKEKVDILIVSLHSGEEYSQKLTQFQIDFSKAAIDAGADLVVGHHPHVVQPNQKYKNGWIFYSLGNFIFDQGFSKETTEGQIIRVLIENGKIKEVFPEEIKINDYFQPEITKQIVGEETVKLKEEIPEKPSLEIYLSADSIEQGDTLLVKISNTSALNEVKGKLGLKKLDFLKLEGSEDWVGIMGIDVKEKPGKYNLIINLSNGNELKREIAIIERKFPVTQLLVTEELKEKGYTPSKILENITTKENVLLKEVLSIYTPKVYFNQPFIYPLEKIKDVGAFGNIRKSGDLALRHLGVDLEADIDTPVYAVNDGLVRFSQDLIDYGKTLIIDHGFGIFSLYLHLKEFKFSEGDLVQQREIIGLSGNTGYSIAPHLHFSVKVNGASVDPLRFIETIEKEI